MRTFLVRLGTKLLSGLPPTASPVMVIAHRWQAISNAGTFGAEFYYYEDTSSNPNCPPVTERMSRFFADVLEVVEIQEQKAGVGIVN